MSEEIDLSKLDLDDSITTRHKKERKELQAKIQALKKSASKNDKKKKKEVLEAIVKLELELDAKHSKELSEEVTAKSINVKTIDSSNDCGSDVNRPVEQERQQYVSKAQKRRDKKAKEDKAKQAEILAQEEINKTGPRTMELKSIKNILKSKNLKLFPIPSDGDCLYNAINHQLSVTGRAPLNTIHLRQLTADYIQDNKDLLICYMSNPSTGDSLTDDEFDKYCQCIRTTPAWGGQIEIKALSNVLKVPIEVLQSSGPPTIQNDENFVGPNLVLTFHRFMYSLGEHYNSTMCFNQDETSSDDG